MKELLIDKNLCLNSKNFYEKIYKYFNGRSIPDWQNCVNLNNNGSLLYEFLWYNKKKDFKLVMKNFDLEKIKEQKTYEDYEWNIIIEVLQDFVKKYPNNKLEFVND